METVKLYEQDVYLGVFEAVVEQCVQEDTLFRVALDQTAFYPEGGGQPADRGTLEGCQVLDVQEQEGVIWHTVEQPLEPGARVKGEINWEFRFGNMQNHTGEHIVSGLIHRMFGLNNVGFHMGSAAVTIDMDGVLTKEQLRAVEDAANQVILQDLPVHVWYPPAQELDGIPYRSKKEIAGPVRLTEIEGVDCCACCGTHTAATGEVRLIKLLSVQNYKGGIRISMLSGEDAFRDYQVRQADMLQLARSLSVKPEQVIEAVERIRKKNIELRREIKQVKRQLQELERGGTP